MMVRILLAASLLLAAGTSLANLTGGGVELIGPGMVQPASEVTFIFEVTNGSSDDEATAAVHFRFPETFRVLDGWYDDHGQGWNLAAVPFGTYGERIMFYDVDDDPRFGEILPGQTGTFYIRVNIAACTECGIYDIDWKQYGDNRGKYPHYLIGTFPYDVCGIAVEETSLSLVKSLY